MEADTSTPVTLKSLAAELGMDRSHLRKFVLGMDIEPLRLRTEASRNQLTLAVTDKQAKRIREARSVAGFGSQTAKAGDPNGNGYVYVVCMDPEARANRVKIGFTVSLEGRMSDYRIANPQAELLVSWAARRTWEVAARDCLTVEAQHVAGEVYDCGDLGDLLKRGDTFFGIMPTVAEGDENG